MAQRLVTRLEDFFHRRTDGHLRSIIRYEPDEYEIVHIRTDVADRYSEDEIKTAIDDSRMESLMAPVYDKTFAEDHGELTCMVKAFENVIEMNFVLDDGLGAAVALDEEAMAETSGLVSDARDLVVNERQ